MQNQAIVKNKKSVIEIFLGGCKKGFYIGVEMIVPAMILGYVIVQFLKLTGLVDILSNVCGPLMGVFGLPGGSIVAILAGFFSKGAGAAAAATLFAEGTINAAQATILIMPCMLMGTLVGHYARIVLVSDVNKKYRLLLLFVPIIDAILGMFLMRLILSFMGLM